MSPGPKAASVRAALRGAAPAHVTVRDMIRRYCREHGKQLSCLAPHGTAKYSAYGACSAAAGLCFRAKSRG